MKLDVTLVVPMLNEAHALHELLEAVSAQTLRPRELIFSDAGSTDGSPAVVEKWWRDHGWEGAECRVLSFPGAMPGAGRNAGVRAARHEWIAFLDAGIAPERDWLERLASCATDKQLEAVFGQCHFSSDLPLGRAVCALSYGQGAVHPVIPASLFRRTVFEKVGFFPEKLRAAEDLIWLSRFLECYGSRETCLDAVVRYTHFPASWSAAFRKWRVTEYHCVMAGARRRQHLVYLALIPLLYGGLLFGAMPGVGVFSLYLILRGVVDPARRSKDRPWWRGQPAAFLIAPPLSAVLDVAKLLGIVGALVVRAVSMASARRFN